MSHQQHPASMYDEETERVIRSLGVGSFIVVVEPSRARANGASNANASALDEAPVFRIAKVMGPVVRPTRPALPQRLHSSSSESARSTDGGPPTRRHRHRAYLSSDGCDSDDYASGAHGNSSNSAARSRGERRVSAALRRQMNRFASASGGASSRRSSVSPHGSRRASSVRRPSHLNTSSPLVYLSDGASKYSSSGNNSNRRRSGDERQQSTQEGRGRPTMSKKAARARRRQQREKAFADGPRVSVVFYDAYGASGDMLRAYALLQETAAQLRAAAPAIFPPPFSGMGGAIAAGTGAQAPAGVLGNTMISGSFLGHTPHAPAGRPAAAGVGSFLGASPAKGRRLSAMGFVSTPSSSPLPHPLSAGTTAQSRQQPDPFGPALFGTMSPSSANGNASRPLHLSATGAESPATSSPIPIPTLPSERDRDGVPLAFSARTANSSIVEQMAFEVAVCDFLAQRERLLRRSAGGAEAGGEDGGGAGVTTQGGGGSRQSPNRGRHSALYNQSNGGFGDVAGANHSTSTAGGGGGFADAFAGAGGGSLTLDLANFRFGDPSPEEGEGEGSSAAVVGGGVGAKNRGGKEARGGQQRGGRSPPGRGSGRGGGRSPPRAGAALPMPSDGLLETSALAAVGDGAIGPGRSPRKRFASFASSEAPTLSLPLAAGGGNGLGSSRNGAVPLAAAATALSSASISPMATSPTLADGGGAAALRTSASPSQQPLASIPFAPEPTPLLLASSFALGATPARRQLFTAEFVTADAFDHFALGGVGTTSIPPLSSAEAVKGNAVPQAPSPSASLPAHRGSIGSAASNAPFHFPDSTKDSSSNALSSSLGLAPASRQISRAHSNAHTSASGTTTLHASLSFGSLAIAGARDWRRAVGGNWGPNAVATGDGHSSPSDVPDRQSHSPNNQQNQPASALSAAASSQMAIGKRLAFPAPLHRSAPSLAGEYIVLLPSERRRKMRGGGGGGGGGGGRKGIANNGRGDEMSHDLRATIASAAPLAEGIGRPAQSTAAAARRDNAGSNLLSKSIFGNVVGSASFYAHLSASVAAPSSRGGGQPSDLAAATSAASPSPAFSSPAPPTAASAAGVSGNSRQAQLARANATAALIRFANANAAGPFATNENAKSPSSGSPAAAAGVSTRRRSATPPMGRRGRRRSSHRTGVSPAIAAASSAHGDKNNGGAVAPSTIFTFGDAFAAPFGAPRDAWIDSARALYYSTHPSDSALVRACHSDPVTAAMLLRQAGGGSNTEGSGNRQASSVPRGGRQQRSGSSVARGISTSGVSTPQRSGAATLHSTPTPFAPLSMLSSTVAGASPGPTPGATFLHAPHLHSGAINAHVNNYSSAASTPGGAAIGGPPRLVVTSPPSVVTPPVTVPATVPPPFTPVPASAVTDSPSHASLQFLGMGVVGEKEKELPRFADDVSGATTATAPSSPAAAGNGLLTPNHQAQHIQTQQRLGATTGGGTLHLSASTPAERQQASSAAAFQRHREALRRAVPVPIVRSVRVADILLTNVPIAEHCMTFRGDQFRESDRPSALAAAAASNAYGGGGLLGIDKAFQGGGALIASTNTAGDRGERAAGGTASSKHHSQANLLRGGQRSGSGAGAPPAPMRSLSRRLTVWLGGDKGDKEKERGRGGSALMPDGLLPSPRPGGQPSGGASAAAAVGGAQSPSLATPSSATATSSSTGRIFKSSVQLAAFLDARIAHAARAAYHARCAALATRKLLAHGRDGASLSRATSPRSSPTSPDDSDASSVEASPLFVLPMSNEGDEDVRRAEASFMYTAHGHLAREQVTAIGTQPPAPLGDKRGSNTTAPPLTLTLLSSGDDGTAAATSTNTCAGTPTSPMLLHTPPPLALSLQRQQSDLDSVGAEDDEGSGGVDRSRRLTCTSTLNGSVKSPTSAMSDSGPWGSGRRRGGGGGSPTSAGRQQRFAVGPAASETAVAPFAARGLRVDSPNSNEEAPLSSSIGRQHRREQQRVERKNEKANDDGGGSSAQKRQQRQLDSKKTLREKREKHTTLTIGDVTWVITNDAASTSSASTTHSSTASAVEDDEGLPTIAVTLSRITVDSVAQLAAALPAVDAYVTSLTAHFMSFDATDALLEELAALVAVRLPFLRHFALIHDDASDVLPVAMTQLLHRPQHVPSAATDPREAALEVAPSSRPLALLAASHHTAKTEGAVGTIVASASSTSNPSTVRGGRGAVGQTSLTAHPQTHSPHRRAVSPILRAMPQPLTAGPEKAPIAVCGHVLREHRLANGAQLSTNTSVGRATSPLLPSIAESTSAVNTSVSSAKGTSGYTRTAAVIPPPLTPSAPPPKRSPFYVTIAGEIPFYTPRDARVRTTTKDDTNTEVTPSKSALTAAPPPSFALAVGNEHTPESPPKKTEKQTPATLIASLQKLLLDGTATATTMAQSSQLSPSPAAMDAPLGASPSSVYGRHTLSSALTPSKPPTAKVVTAGHRGVGGRYDDASQGGGGGGVRGGGGRTGSPRGSPTRNQSPNGGGFGGGRSVMGRREPLRSYLAVPPSAAALAALMGSSLRGANAGASTTSPTHAGAAPSASSGQQLSPTNAGGALPLRIVGGASTAAVLMSAAAVAAAAANASLTAAPPIASHAGGGHQHHHGHNHHHHGAATATSSPPPVVRHLELKASHALDVTAVAGAGSGAASSRGQAAAKPLSAAGVVEGRVSVAVGVQALVNAVYFRLMCRAQLCEQYAERDTIAATEEEYKNSSASAIDERIEWGDGSGQTAAHVPSSSHGNSNNNKRFLPLESIAFIGCLLDDANLCDLSAVLPLSARVSLSGNRLGAAFVQRLAAATEALMAVPLRREVERGIVSGTSSSFVVEGIDSAGLAEVVAALPTAHYCSSSGNNGAATASRRVATLARLKELNLSGNAIADDALPPLLDLVDCQRLRDRPAHTRRPPSLRLKNAAGDAVGASFSSNSSSFVPNQDNAPFVPSSVVRVVPLRLIDLSFNRLSYAMRRDLGERLGHFVDDGDGKARKGRRGKAPLLRSHPSSSTYAPLAWSPRLQRDDPRQVDYFVTRQVITALLCMRGRPAAASRLSPTAGADGCDAEEERRDESGGIGRLSDVLCRNAPRVDGRAAVARALLGSGDEAGSSRQRTGRRRAAALAQLAAAAEAEQETRKIGPHRQSKRAAVPLQERDCSIAMYILSFLPAKESRARVIL